MSDLYYESQLTGKKIEDAITYIDGLPLVFNSINEDISNLESNKAPNSAIPTKVSQLENDRCFITDAYTKTEVDSKITGVYKCKGTISDYYSLPSSNQQVGDVYNVTAEYSKTFYGYNVVNVCFAGQGLAGESAYMTLDSITGFSAGDVISVCDSGKTILGSFTVQSVDTTNKKLTFLHATNSDYWSVLFKIKGNSNEGETTVNTVFYFLGNHITSSTGIQGSIMKILYSAGSNVVWDGLTWDSLPGIIDFSDYYNKTQIDDMIVSAIGAALGGAY